MTTRKVVPTVAELADVISERFGSMCLDNEAEVAQVATWVRQLLTGNPGALARDVAPSDSDR